MSIEEIMEKLFGTIEPVGETYEDQKRLENIDRLETALNYIIQELINAYEYIESNKYSELKIAEASKEILVYLKNKLKDTLDEI